MRYYYDDPLQAAWMKREFDIKIYQPESSEYQQEIFGFSQLLDEIVTPQFNEMPYFVHPDSYEMLKPQVGDLIEYSAHKTEYIAGDDKLHHEASMDGFISLKDFNKDWGGELAPIIQRQGKAFFTPLEMD